jgi:hypothetical protein
MSVQVERTPGLPVLIETENELASWSGQGIDSAYRFDRRTVWFSMACPAATSMTDTLVMAHVDVSL